MAGGAVPYFIDLESLPPRTLALYPRHAIAEAMRLPGVHVDRSSPLFSPSTSSKTDSEPKAEPWYLNGNRFTVDRTIFNRSRCVRGGRFIASIRLIYYCWHRHSHVPRYLK